MKKILFFSLLGFIQLYSQDQEIDSLNVQKLEEVLVSSIRVNEDIPMAFTNVSKDQIEERNLGQDLPILLNFLPNVVTTSDAGAGIGYTAIRIRGINAQSTNVTINGIPYNDAESLGTFWVDLPDFSSSIENLQVQRGIGTSVNGSSAFGASINILTDKISKDPFFESNNTFGSYNTFKNTLRFSTGLMNEVFEFSGRLSKIDSDGYIDRSTSDLKSYLLQFSYKKENTLIKFLNFGGHEITYHAWNGIDGETLRNNRTFNPSGLYTDLNGVQQFHEDELDNYKQDHFQLHWSEIINNNFTSNLGLNLTNGKGYYEQYNENENEDFITRKWLDNQFVVVNYSLKYSKNKHNIIFGSTYSEYDGDHFGESIDLAGDVLVIGAHGDDDKGLGSGSVYVFVRSGETWVKKQKLVAEIDGADGDSFGYSVALSSETIVVGAHMDDDKGSESGSVYIFVRSDENTWTQQQKIVVDDGAWGDQFGITQANQRPSVVVPTEVRYERVERVVATCQFERHQHPIVKRLRHTSVGRSSSNRRGRGCRGGGERRCRRKGRCGRLYPVTDERSPGSTANDGSAGRASEKRSARNRHRQLLGDQQVR